MSHIILTGASGFLGTVIKNTLAGSKIYSLGRAAVSNYRVDLTKAIPVFTGEFDIVIHNAGKAHIVPKSIEENESFYEVNVTGTRHLLLGLEKSAIPKSFVFISTVAVYGLQSGNNINEDYPLLAQDPYGHSKILAEELIMEWCKKHHVLCSILRLPLIAGTTPPGNLKAMINGIRKGYYFDIAGGSATKSMVLAEDVAKIIPNAAKIGGIYNLTDGYHPSFSELSALIAAQLGKRKPANIPGWLAKCMAKAGDTIGSKAPINSDKLRKITSDLTFDDSKARKQLGWSPTPVLEGFRIV